MLRTHNFHTLYELCDFVRENNIDVYSEDVKYLGEYVFSPAVMGTCNAVCFFAGPGASSGISYRPMKYTIQYEDNQNNVGPLEPRYVRYVEDFSED